MKPRSLAIAMAGAVLYATGSASSQSMTVEQILARADAYVRDFVARFTGVVAEERTTQTDQRGLTRVQRDLISDYLLVQEPATSNWMSFRDVVNVDGRRVSDRGERLTRLFLEPSGDVLGRARQISQDGARFNLAGIGTLNDPLTALTFVQSRYSPRFQWSLVKRDTNAGPDVWVVAFEEQSRPTILRWTSDNLDLPAAGLVWIDSATGRVSRTELKIEVGGFLATLPRPAFAAIGRDEVVTTVQFDERFRISVPVEMRERHTYGTSDVNGVTRYGRFRRFQVRTDEKIQEPR